MPELGELQRLAIEQEELDDALVAAETAVSDLEADQARAETDLEPVRERLARNRKRIADGTVPDPKALNSMIEEVAHLEEADLRPRGCRAGGDGGAGGGDGHA